MTTLRYKLFEIVMRLTGAGRSIDKGMARGNVPSEAVPSSLRQRWERSAFEGRPIFTCRPEGKDTGRVYVHQHGGGYVLGLIGLHFSMFTKLADMAGVTIILPDYPLPPDMTSDEIISWAVKHFETVVGEHGADLVSLGGDSAGGNLALAISQKMSIKAPLLLLSPWVDLEAADMPDNMASPDFLLNVKGLKLAGARYAAPRQPNDPLISPIFADPETLGDVMIFTGERDLLFGQIKVFSDRMKAAGKLTKFASYGEFGHYWMFYPTSDRNSTLVEIAGILTMGVPPNPHAYLP